MKQPPLSPMATLRWSVVARILAQLAPKRVLEVGCGQGGFGARIAALPGVGHYVGVEPDETSWAVAHERITPLGGEVRLGTSDLLGADEHFDLVCAFEVIEHIEDDRAALASWAAHLVPGGTVLVSVPAGPERFGPMDALVGHYRRYTPAQLVGLPARGRVRRGRRHRVRLAAGLRARVGAQPDRGAARQRGGLDRARTGCRRVRRRAGGCCSRANWPARSCGSGRRRSRSSSTGGRRPAPALIARGAVGPR